MLCLGFGTWAYSTACSVGDCTSLLAVHLGFLEEGTQMQWPDPVITPEATRIEIVKDMTVHACPTVLGTILAGYN